jgi:hypothetical protein
VRRLEVQRLSPRASPSGQAELLVKLSGRLPRVRTLYLNSAETIQALSLHPPPSGKQRAYLHGTSAPLIHSTPNHNAASLPPCLPSAVRVAKSGPAEPRPLLAYFPLLEDLRVGIDVEVSGE